MDGPWGRPGPGGTTWRNPRDIGLHFAKSMVMLSDIYLPKKILNMKNAASYTSY